MGHRQGVRVEARGGWCRVQARGEAWGAGARVAEGHLPGGGRLGLGTERAERSALSAIARLGWGWGVAPAVPGTAGVGGGAGAAGRRRL